MIKTIRFRTGQKDGEPVYPQSVSGLASRAHVMGYIRSVELDTCSLSGLARFLAENINLVWPGNIFSTQAVDIYSENPDAYHKRQAAKTEADKARAEAFIQCYDLENVYSPINYMYNFDYLVGKETANEFFERHAGLIRSMGAGRVVIGLHTFLINQKAGV